MSKGAFFGHSWALLMVYEPTSTKSFYLTKTVWLVSWPVPHWLLEWLHARASDFGALGDVYERGKRVNGPSYSPHQHHRRVFFSNLFLLTSNASPIPLSLGPSSTARLFLLFSSVLSLPPFRLVKSPIRSTLAPRSRHSSPP